MTPKPVSLLIPCFPGGRSAEVGIHGYWGAYYNIFSLCKQLGLQPFTDWTASHQYSNKGLEVVAPVFRVSPFACTRSPGVSMCTAFPENSIGDFEKGTVRVLSRYECAVYAASYVRTGRLALYVHGLLHTSVSVLVDVFTCMA